jgi:hypothetical protein
MPFIVKCVGGPAEGVRICDDLAEYGLAWPLPDELPGTESLGGVYRKVSESQLPVEVASSPHVGVGAEFRWVPSG